MHSNLQDRYCIVGVGETDYSRGSGRSTRALATEAILNAMADAGLTPKDIDGMLSYHGGDSTTSSALAYDMGIRLNFYMDCSGGGSSTEALVGLAIGAIEAGMCETVAIFRSMNGYSQVRIGGTGPKASAPVSSADLLRRPYGLGERVAESFAFTFTRHMMEYGVTERGPGAYQGCAQQSREQQSQGADEEARHGGRRSELPLDREALRAPSGLLFGDRQRDLHHHHLG